MDNVASPTQAVMELERAYLLQNYGRYPLVLKRGRGCWLTDLEGKRYLDLISGIGVNSLGYAHPRILRVMKEQAGQLIHSSNLYYHEYQGPLAKKLCETSGLQRTFFCNSGTEAIEGAIKMAHSHGRRIDPEKTEIVALENSFHGRTIGALSITGQPKYRKDFEPLMPGVKFVNMCDEAGLEAAITDKTAAVFLETIQGEGGIYPMPAELLRKARALTEQHNALLVFDEIQCGIGRPGTHFAYQLHEPAILPDIVTMAKPIACGLPLGAILCNEKAAASIAPGMHGTTFGGGALACRVALEFYEILEELLPQMRRVGAYFLDGLRVLQQKHSIVKDVRGFGLMIGVEIDFPCRHFVKQGMELGLLFNVTHDNVVRMLPPYIITEKEVDRALKGLSRIFKHGKPQE
ncbi:aspartate aminotransferase family protein [Paludibaculum fermentans]|uniref:Acetylornithine aminotransferase n=1 Tax=Paludibaculum fermentans TaxID=1473598 RepID=A0A7S7NKA8_PALFE|nr:aspartate aminotransferase family protein [Paludibaculum fermentans]QOY85203.1 aspartate aminotransferase family protein [Paludibaculum fermentans]